MKIKEQTKKLAQNTVLRFQMEADVVWRDSRRVWEPDFYVHSV